MSKLIKDFLSNDTKVSDYRMGLMHLKRSGFLDVLRRLGLPRVINNGSDLNAMAHEGSWSNGFQTGINVLEDFENIYEEKSSSAIINPTFGGESIAKREGYLTQDELNKIQKGENKK